MEIEQIDANKAWEILANQSNACLVDVRTREEQQGVGMPDLSSLDKKVILLPWQAATVFCKVLKEQLPDPSIPLLFLCRRGVRSQAAAEAMQREGYTACYNIADGFEGKQEFLRINGWKNVNLPWR